MISDPTLPLEAQFFQKICVIGGALCLGVVYPLNLFQNQSPWVNRGILAFGALCLMLAWAARNGRYYKKICVIALIAVLDLIWFPNGGASGSVGPFFFVAGLFIVVMFSAVSQIIGLGLLATNVVVLLLIEYNDAGLVTQFETPTDRFVDLTTGYTVCLLASAVILFAIKTSFYREKLRADANLQALKETEAELRAVFESAQDAIVVANRRTMLMINPACTLMFGYAGAAELLGHDLLELVAPESHELVLAHLRVKAKRKTVRTNREAIGLKKDGSRFPLEVHLATYERDECLHTVASIRDLSEEKRIENERQHLDSQMRRSEKMESLGALAGGIAHDMNNVLSAVMGLASVQLEDVAADTDLHHDLETITRACERGATMVRGLLSFARETLPEKRETALNVVVSETVALLERTTLQKIRLDVDLAPDLLSIQADAAALTHALMNLCVNAMDAMPDGGMLTLRTRNHHESEVLLEVVDTGCGMPSEVLNKALDPFFTTKPMGKGTGLGLPIVFGTIKAHHGRMEIQSSPGQGTLVQVYLPAQKDSLAAPSPAEKRTSIPTARSLNVLLIDDDELIQHTVHRILRAAGHTVTTVSGGIRAVTVVEAGLRPDLVVLDMNMPELDGAATLPRLRELIPNVPVVLSTGQADQDARSLAASHTLVTLLPKPFNAIELGQKVDSLAKRAGH
jgi:PAS domain S-box-containing protein